MDDLCLINQLHYDVEDGGERNQSSHLFFDLYDADGEKPLGRTICETSADEAIPNSSIPTTKVQVTRNVSEPFF